MKLMFWYFCFSTSKNSVDKDCENCISRAEGVTKRYDLYIVTIYTHIGEQFCRTLLKAHLGTGADCLSKIETKKSSFNAHPEVALKELGESVLLDKQQNPRS